MTPAGLRAGVGPPRRFLVPEATPRRPPKGGCDGAGVVSMRCGAEPVSVRRPRHSPAGSTAVTVHGTLWASCGTSGDLQTAWGPPDAAPPSGGRVFGGWCVHTAGCVPRVGTAQAPAASAPASWDRGGCCRAGAVIGGAVGAGLSHTAVRVMRAAARSARLSSRRTRRLHRSRTSHQSFREPPADAAGAADRPAGGPLPPPNHTCAIVKLHITRVLSEYCTCRALMSRSRHWRHSSGILERDLCHMNRAALAAVTSVRGAVITEAAPTPTTSELSPHRCRKWARTACVRCGAQTGATPVGGSRPRRTPPRPGPAAAAATEPLGCSRRARHCPAARARPRTEAAVPVAAGTRRRHSQRVQPRPAPGRFEPSSPTPAPGAITTRPRLRAPAVPATISRARGPSGGYLA